MPAARRRLIVCTAAFVVVMGLFSIVWRWFVYTHGASWLEVGAVIGGLLAIAAVIDRRDRQRDDAAG